MGSVNYIDAVNAALDRLHTTGFYIGDFFANHGPMAAEALAKLGYCEQVEGWVDANIAHRQHGLLPKPSEPISDWRVALGDRNRGGDWVQLFRHQLAEAPWRDVLRTWWPRLLPGCAGSLTHGLIRTAHAVRSLRETDRPSELQVDELARALAFWATVWGVVGMIMAVPLMVAVKIVLENIPHARPLAALLTNVPANAGKG